jgi:hypothetical protein
MSYVSTLMRIQPAFEQAGIRFLDNDAGGGIGVRLIKPKLMSFFNGICLYKCLYCAE